MHGRLGAAFWFFCTFFQRVVAEPVPASAVATVGYAVRARLAR
jgi:hypothetical protein